METDKSEIIIEAAQKRFGIYGAEKTSMREIADDLKMSKAALYYYFPDKESLYKAVVVKEQNQFLKMISERIHDESGPELLLHDYSRARLIYFRSLLNLSRLRLESLSDLKPVFRETLNSFRDKEMEIIITIFRKGIETGLFKIENPEKTASLFLDLLKGLRITVVNNKTTMLMEPDEFDKLLEKTFAFTDIFIKGLKAN